MKKICFFALSLVGWSCINHRGDSDYKPYLETDDDFRPSFESLQDVSKKLNDHVFQVITKAIDANPSQAPTNKVQPDVVIQRVYEALSLPRVGSGFGVGRGTTRIEVSAFTEIEAWLDENLDEAKGEKRSIKFKESRYRLNPVGFSGLSKGQWPRKPSHLTEWTANHSIAPVIKVGNVYLGIDKFAHFFEQGYWYYKTKVQEGSSSRPLTEQERFQFGQYMEGDGDLPKELHSKYQKIFASWCRTCASFGYYGSASTGVISYADMNANEVGRSFYLKLEGILKAQESNPEALKASIQKFVRFEQFSPEKMNESLVPNRYKDILVSSAKN